MQNTCAIKLPINMNAYITAAAASTRRRQRLVELCKHATRHQFRMRRRQVSELTFDRRFHARFR